MADVDDTLDEVKDESVVEDASSDEADSSEIKEEETDENATAEEESEDESDAEQQAFEKRFPRFKGETLEEYVKNLEDGYSNSSAEAVRISRELKRLKEDKMSQIANSGADDTKEEPAKKEDPALIYARQKMEEDAQRDYRSFSEAHPEVDETSESFDESLFEEFDKEAGYARDYLYRKTGKIPTLMEAMQRAWAVMNPETVSKEEKIAMAAKSAGAGSKAKGAAKEQPKSKFSDAQIENVKKMDPKLEDKSRAEIEEILSKYIK
jgi:hypothetical protein